MSSIVTRYISPLLGSFIANFLYLWYPIGSSFVSRCPVQGFAKDAVNILRRASMVLIYKFCECAAMRTSN